MKSCFLFPHAGMAVVVNELIYGRSYIHPEAVVLPAVASKQLKSHET